MFLQGPGLWSWPRHPEVTCQAGQLSKRSTGGQHIPAAGFVHRHSARQLLCLIVAKAQHRSGEHRCLELLPAHMFPAVSVWFDRQLPVCPAEARSAPGWLDLRKTILPSCLRISNRLGRGCRLGLSAHAYDYCVARFWYRKVWFCLSPLENDNLRLTRNACKRLTLLESVYHDWLIGCCRHLRARH